MKGNKNKDRTMNEVKEEQDLERLEETENRGRETGQVYKEPHPNWGAGGGVQQDKRREEKWVKERIENDGGGHVETVTTHSRQRRNWNK